MIRQQFLLWFFLPLLMLTGCGKDGLENVSGNVTNPGVGDIRFGIAFTPRTEPAGGNDTPQTRVATASDFKSSWEDDDAIGIFAVLHGNTPTSANVYNNVRMTYSESTKQWSLDNGVELWFPTDGSKLDFYAYYPYNASIPDPTNITFNVQTNQNGTTGGKSNYNLSELLTAKSDNDGTGWSKADNPVSLTFTHALALVEVTIPVENKSSDPDENLIVKLREMQAKAILNLSEARVRPATTDNAPLNITMYRVEQPSDTNYDTSYTYRALVPAQDVAKGNRLFWFEHKSEEQLFGSPALTSPLGMEAGKAERYKISLP